jgi:hypothetical protein
MASTAATAGVLLGGFVAFQLLATPQPRPDGAPAPQVAVETKVAPKPVAETNGSTPVGDSVASTECDQQTWPHLSRACMEEYRKQRAARVITTDKLDKSTISAIEASPPPAIETKATIPAAVTPAAAEPSPVAAVPTPPAAPAEVEVAVAAPAPVAKPAPTTTTTVFAAPEPPPAAVKAEDAQPPSQATVKAEAKKEKREAKKSKRKPKVDIKSPVRPDADDEDDSVVSSADSDDRDVADGRSRRIVERWTERDYDVPDAYGRGQRRVTVIRRSGGGGLFESLFGN